MSLSNIQLGTSETTIHLASGESIILAMMFCNTGTSAVDITVYAYPTGGAAGASTTIISNFEIPALDTYFWASNEKILLASGDRISGIASTASQVTVTVNYKVL